MQAGGRGVSQAGGHEGSGQSHPGLGQSCKNVTRYPVMSVLAQPTLGMSGPLHETGTDVMNLVSLLVPRPGWAALCWIL